jgi:hypothetical protein
MTRAIRAWELASRPDVVVLLEVLLALGLGAGWRFLGPMLGPIDGPFVATR